MGFIVAPRLFVSRRKDTYKGVALKEDEECKAVMGITQRALKAAKGADRMMVGQNHKSDATRDRDFNRRLHR